MRARMAAAATAFLVISLGCARGNRSGDIADTGDVEDNDAYFDDIGVVCNGADWEFSAVTIGEVSTLEVEPWLGDTQYATQDLVHRGGGDWFLSAQSGLVGADCSYTDQFVLFRGYAANGATFEETTQ